jgi:hypothetical protein
MGGQGASDFGFGDASQALAGRSARRDRGEAPLQVAVLLEIASHQGRDGESIVGIEVAAAEEVVGQGAGLVERRGLEGGHELDLVNQAVLQSEQAEEQVTFGVDGGHGAGLPEGRHGRWTSGPRHRGPAARCAGSGDYLMRDRPIHPRRGRSDLPRVRQPRRSACGRPSQRPG